jgi:hypothetical protein
MDIEESILNGYLKLYCKIKGVPCPICHICGHVLDGEYKKRKHGLLCKNCCRQFMKERMYSYRHQT